MSDEGHRLKVERFFECFNRRDLDGLREVLHADIVEVRRSRSICSGAIYPKTRAWASQERDLGP